MNELDKWFPRNNPPKKTTTGDVMHIEGFGMATGTGTLDNAPWQPEPRRKKKKRDPNNPTSKQLERIGESLTKRILKKYGINLEKIPTGYNYYGHPQSTDVDFRATNWQPLKVEAKTWWAQRNKYFSLSRISKKERSYLNNGIAGGYHCWLSIAMLFNEPTQSACAAVYIVTWQQWLAVEEALLLRAKGQYKGQSLRVRDLDLLDGYAIMREGKPRSPWRVPSDHWLNEVLKKDGAK